MTITTRELRTKMAAGFSGLETCPSKPPSYLDPDKLCVKCGGSGWMQNTTTKKFWICPCTIPKGNELKTKTGKVSQSGNAKTKSTIEIAWQNALEQLRLDMPKASYNKYLKPTHALYVLDDKFVVEVETLDAAEWLESRVTSTASRLLAGIMNRGVTVRFTVKKETE